VAATAPVPFSTALDDVFAHWVAGGQHTEQTLARMTETVLRFQRRLAATGRLIVADVQPADVRGFVLAQTRYGTDPEVPTQHARRTAVRTLFRTLRHLGLVVVDPTVDLLLPPRGQRAARPLTDDEVVLCRASAQVGVGARTPVRAVVWALGETGAVSSEITQVRLQDLDSTTQLTGVQLPGTRRHDPREALLSGWGAQVVGRRSVALLRAGAPGSTLVAYGGAAPAGGAKAQAVICNALREVLDRAGLQQESDIRPASLRNWTGRQLYDQGQAIEQVAAALGHRSLDAAAEDIGLTWRSPLVAAQQVAALQVAR